MTFKSKSISNINNSLKSKLMHYYKFEKLRFENDEEYGKSSFIFGYYKGFFVTTIMNKYYINKIVDFKHTFDIESSKRNFHYSVFKASCIINTSSCSLLHRSHNNSVFIDDCYDLDLYSISEDSE